MRSVADIVIPRVCILFRPSAAEHGDRDQEREGQHDGNPPGKAERSAGEEQHNDQSGRSPRDSTAMPRNGPLRRGFEVCVRIEEAHHLRVRPDPGSKHASRPATEESSRLKPREPNTYSPFAVWTPDRSQSLPARTPSCEAVRP